jgi:hypothetical protein
MESGHLNQLERNFSDDPVPFTTDEKRWLGTDHQYRLGPASPDATLVTGQLLVVDGGKVKH